MSYSILEDTTQPVKSPFRFQVAIKLADEPIEWWTAGTRREAVTRGLARVEELGALEGDDVITGAIGTWP